MLAPAISRRLFSLGIAAGFAALTVRGARAVLARDLASSREPETVHALARGVLSWVKREPSPSDFATGSRRFSGEWAFATPMMAAIGLAQLAWQAPRERAEIASAIETLIDRIIDPRVSAFSREAWGSDPLRASSEASPEGILDGHAAYLGYLNLAVGMLRVLAPASRHASLGVELTEAVGARVAESPSGLVATYPGETYPVDNTALLASLHLGEALEEKNRSAELERGLAAIARATDPETGLLVQSVDPTTGAARDSARGSGTCLASYFLSFVDRGLSADLWGAVKRELLGQALGFQAVREYRRGDHQKGDIDSGPVLLGWGVSASGFALGAARANGDDAIRRDIYATASLFGAPTRITAPGEPDSLLFVTGGPLGDALLLAMLTAPNQSIALTARSGHA